MILKFEVYMTRLQENRMIHMYLPDDYLYSGKTYPVLYMFDGHNLFHDEDAFSGTSWRIHEQIEEMEKDLIVVGQEGSQVGNNRLSEYAPFSYYDPDFGVIDGLGRQTMDFFVHDLKPFIDTHFPTRPDRRNTFIGGSSCGGAMALYGLYKYSQTFSKGLAISPYINACINSYLADISRTYILKNSSLYFSWGAHEGRGHEFIEETSSITQAANLLLGKGVRVLFNVKPQGEHSEASWQLEGPDFLRFLLP